MRRHLRISLPILAGLALLMGHAEPVAAISDVPREPRGVLWGGRLFTDADDLRAWLEQRHRSYEVWALRHPDAVAQLDPLDPVAPPDESWSLPRIGWAAIVAALIPAVLALGLALWPPTLAIARRRIELAAFGVGVIAAGATAIVVAA